MGHIIKERVGKMKSSIAFHLPAKKYGSYELKPIEQTNRMTGSFVADMKAAGIGGKYRTAIIDWRKMKVLSTHI
jgi:hypothetical protein